MISVPTTQQTRVQVLRAEDADAAVDLLTRGFAEEPGNLALFPDPQVREVVIRSSFGRQVAAALPCGTVHGAYVGDVLAGAALWHPPGVGGPTVRGVARAVRGAFETAPLLARQARHLRTTLFRQPGQALRLPATRGRAVQAASRGATWHLAFLATAPEFRGRGVARSLLDRQLRRCDEDGAAVWLETTDPVNPPIYERFGFEVLTHIEDAAWLPGFWVMRREPRPV